MKYVLITLLLTAFPAWAETTLTAQEFEALSLGKTLYFSKDGKAYGSEHYYKGRISKWRYSDGECANGEWFIRNDLFCFNYEDVADTQCWSFVKTDKGGYAARAEGAALGDKLDLDFIDRKPLLCKRDGLAV
jgi:hypothetical protein